MLTLQLSKNGDVLSLLYFGGGGNTGLTRISFLLGVFVSLMLTDESSGIAKKI
jgi:hypothetical protein